MNSLFLLALGVATFVAAPADSAARKESGTVVSRLNHTLVVIDSDQTTTRKYDVPDDTPIMLDGKAAKLADLQPGDAVVVSLTDDQVVGVEARSGKLKAAAQLTATAGCETKASLSSTTAVSRGSSA